VSGVVVGADGAPVAGVPVVAAPIGLAGSVMLELDGVPPPTGADGRFSLEVAQGKHMVLALGTGGPGARKPIDVTSGQVLDAGKIVLGGEPPPGPGGPSR
jgi:hypothetical protein